MDKDVVKLGCINRREVNWTGVHNVVMDEHWRVLQAGGYTENRGLFLDTYPHE